MKLLVQRVARADVTVDGESIGAVGQGYALFLGVMRGDTENEVRFLVHKILGLRLFAGDDGTVNHRSIVDVHGGILVVSQFTLAGLVEKGNRPDYTAAADRETAMRLYEAFLAILRSAAPALIIATGRFGAHMHVDLVNDGPVTLLLERKPRMTGDGSFPGA